PLTSRLVKTAAENPTLVVTSAADEASGRLTDAGCQILQVVADRVASIRQLLEWMGKKRWTNILVEGGAEVLGAFLDANVIDEAHAFIAPRLLGGAKALAAVAGSGIHKITEAWTPAGQEIATLDSDVYFHVWREADRPSLTTHH